MFFKDAAERSIALGFLSTANWRENVEAATRLRKLSSGFRLTDSDWILLEGHFKCADARRLVAVRTTNRQIGFVHNPADATEYVVARLSNLTSGGVQ